MINCWLEFSDARKIAADLQRRYAGLDSDCIDDIMDDFENHALIRHDWELEINFDDFGGILWIQVFTKWGGVPQ